MRGVARARPADHVGIVEVVDLRSLVPLDRETVLDSVKKTNRALIVHEANITAGFGAEIAALIADYAESLPERPVLPPVEPGSIAPLPGMSRTVPSPSAASKSPPRKKSLPSMSPRLARRSHVD